jgi:DNA-binding NarL/FixJ family response regulator
LLRHGVESVLAASGDISVVATTGDLPGLLDAVAEHDPDVVLTDIRMPPTGTDEGIVAAALFRAERPAMGVLVLSQYAEPALAIALLDPAASHRGYLLKERLADGAELSAAIRTVASGGSVVDPVIVESLVAARSRRRASPLATLTPRELEVLGEIARGRSNAAIAASLVVSPRSVEKHINSVFSKLGLTGPGEVDRRVTAVLLYLSDGGGGTT